MPGTISSITLASACHVPLNVGHPSPWSVNVPALSEVEGRSVAKLAANPPNTSGSDGIGAAVCGAPDTPMPTAIVAAAAIAPTRCFMPSSYMHTRPPQRIRLRLAQHLARHRRGVAFAERQEFQHVGDRVAFGPPEIHVRKMAGAIADVQQQRGDRVRDRGTLAAQHAIRANPGALQAHR